MEPHSLADAATLIESHPTDARPFLLLGAAAGPIYVAIGALEALTRDGFDISRHSLSLLANGPGGWMHSVMMVGTGVLTMVGAAGLARSFTPGGGPRWMVRGIGIYGAGLAVAGLLRADPMDGFPPGTADGPPAEVTWHGIGHLAAGGIGFLGLMVAALVAARWFHRTGRSRWAAFSLVTGLFYLVSFAGIASGAGNATVNLAFTGAVALGWAWLTTVLTTAPAGDAR